MKFLVSSSVLLKNLLNINGVVATNPIVPILENFLLRIDAGEDTAGSMLTVTASDLQTTMTTQIPVDASEGGSIAIPAKLLLDTLRSLPDQPITININTETFGTEILTDNGRYKISGENPIDFPKIPTVNKNLSVELSSDGLLSAINNTVFATSTDDLRPAMTGVYLQLSNDAGTGTATFVATDGHRLIRYRRTNIQTPDSPAADRSLIIPRKALTLLKSSLPEGVPVQVDLSQANASFTFGTPSTQLICRLIDERFPDYENAIPVNNTNVMTIGRADLLNSLKRIMIYANRTTHQIRLSLKGNRTDSASGGPAGAAPTLTISAEDLDYANEANEKLLCDYDGDDMEIGFNAKLMAEMLSNLSAKMISLEMSAPNRAGLIIPADKEEDEEILMLVMPVMLNTYA